ncbi:MAG: CDP-alcohol phosphatidyltransferase family protein [Burkholderiales bacterium]
MKNIPNTITVVRILLSAILLFLKPLSTVFWIIYSLCGISDIIDGYIARKTNSTSMLGAILDSIADIAFISAAIVVFIPIISISKGILIWIILIALVRVVSMFVGYCKYRVFAILHTYSNKATGILLFCFPYLYNSINMKYSASIICAIASISAVEELVIHITSKRLSRDVKGIFAK